MTVDARYQKLLARVAVNIKKARMARGLTQEDMVKKGFNYRHYQKIESGAYSFSLYTLQRLAAAFGTEIRSFFD